MLPSCEHHNLHHLWRKNVLTVGNSNFYMYLHVRQLLPAVPALPSIKEQREIQAKRWGCFVASWLGVVLVVFIILLLIR